MKTIQIYRYVLLLFISLHSLHAVSDTDEVSDPRVGEARQIVKAFGKALVTELKQALQEGGPEQAIQVCNIRAPEITDLLSKKNEWDIGRTSLKTRNQNNNPDEWEQTVLQQFEQHKQQGEEIKTLENYEETSDGFRYMKAIPTKGLCLTCHGSEIPEPVESLLSEFYPEDKATGFKIGDIRGAFTMMKLK